MQRSGGVRAACGSEFVIVQTGTLVATRSARCSAVANKRSLVRTNRESKKVEKSTEVTLCSKGKSMLNIELTGEGWSSEVHIVTLVHPKGTNNSILHCDGSNSVHAHSQQTREHISSRTAL